MNRPDNQSAKTIVYYAPAAAEFHAVKERVQQSGKGTVEQNIIRETRNGWIIEHVLRESSEGQP